MVGFRDFDGVGIAPVSNKMAVKTLMQPTSRDLLICLVNQF